MGCRVVREFSSLSASIRLAKLAVYVQAEKVPLAPRRASGETRSTEGRAGWRRGLAEGAYSAGVIGAALGL